MQAITLQEYGYSGCVTAFSQNDTPTVWQPKAMGDSVQAESNEYTERLVAVNLLAGQIGCMPTAITIDNQTPLPVGASFVLTYSVNDEPPMTHMGTIQAFAPTPALAFITFIREYEFIDKVTNQPTYIFAGDGGGNCFISSPTYIFSNTDPVITYSGFAADESNPAFTPLANSITFYPTSDLMDSQDLYHFIAGGNPPPSLTIHSCAVFQKMGI